jgi:hypothetical protein
MSGNKNIKSQLESFFRYIRNEMTDRERNAFERQTQKDPFMEEALDGYASMDEKDLINDLADINEHLVKKKTRRTRSVFYRIAASAAVFIALTALLIFIPGKHKEQIALNTPEKETLEIQQSKPVNGPVDLQDKINDLTEKDANLIISSHEEAAPEKIAVNKQYDSIVKEKIQIEPIGGAVTEMARSRAIVSPPASKEYERKKSESGYAIKGQVISNDDKLPIAGATVRIKGTKYGVITDMDGNFSLNVPDTSDKILSAEFIGMESKEIKASPDSIMNIRLNPNLSSLSEVVVVGYSISKKAYDEDDPESSYMHAVPEGGRASFNEYVERNLHRPDISDKTRKVVVVLNFMVRTSGEIDSIRVIKSPGQQFSDEAIRVLKQGPEWKPAQLDGNAVDEDVRLRMVFK